MYINTGLDLYEKRGCAPYIAMWIGGNGAKPVDGMRHQFTDKSINPLYQDFVRHFTVMTLGVEHAFLFAEAWKRSVRRMILTRTHFRLVNHSQPEWVAWILVQGWATMQWLSCSSPSGGFNPYDAAWQKSRDFPSDKEKEWEGKPLSRDFWWMWRNSLRSGLKDMQAAIRWPSVLFRGVLSLNSGRRTSSRVLGRGTKSSFPPAWGTRAMWWCHSWPNGSIWMVGWKKAIWKFGKQRMDLMYKWSPWKHPAQRNFYRGSKTASGSIKTRSCGTWKTTRIPIFHWCMLTSLPQKPGKLFKSFWISCPQPKWAASFSILVRNPGLSSWLRRVASHAFRGFVVWRANVMILRSTMCSRWPLWLGGFLWPAQASSNALFGDLRVGWNNSGRTEWPRSAGMLPFTKDPSVSSFDHPACFAHGWGGPKVHKTTLLVSDKGPNFQVFKAGVPPIYWKSFGQRFSAFASLGQLWSTVLKCQFETLNSSCPWPKAYVTSATRSSRGTILLRPRWEKSATDMPMLKFSSQIPKIHGFLWKTLPPNPIVSPLRTDLHRWLCVSSILQQVSRQSETLEVIECDRVSMPVLYQARWWDYLTRLFNQ